MHSELLNSSTNNSIATNHNGEQPLQSCYLRADQADSKPASEIGCEIDMIRYEVACLTKPNG
jgi:hypothetical protein